MADYDLLATTEECHETEKCPLVFTQSSPSVSSDESKEEVSLTSQVLYNSSKYKRLNHQIIYEQYMLLICAYAYSLLTGTT